MSEQQWRSKYTHDFGSRINSLLGIDCISCFGRVYEAVKD